MIARNRDVRTNAVVRDDQRRLEQGDGEGEDQGAEGAR
jgi:hypothetical protein